MMNDTAIRNTLTVNVVYLARLREAFGCAAEHLPLHLTTEIATVNDVLAALASRGGAFATELATGRAVRVAVNHTLVSREARVRHGDEVALLPPVTGG
jgi:molybdopterin synthase sulfur carrier subunit